MSVLFKATLAFFAALAVSGQLRLETPRWHAVAHELAAVHPRATLVQQVRHFLAGKREPA